MKQELISHFVTRWWNKTIPLWFKYSLL